MDMQAIEDELVAIIVGFERELPAAQVAEMQELTKAGEPGIALENLCTQLYEYDVAVDTVRLQQIAAVGHLMGIDENYWQALASHE
ncbi:hypothetical protein Pla108_13800 [Botrimarina colliarenosi]|uniref:MafI family immunity protein n=1 Tax=Botrimarina colliarenosi TaxID=2528001 RepID=A0A5C6AMD1_9BACT|nr:MafI family immunity protein [Botrimarina colliarenosi]TWU00429.1 hypothetical protein Pla108_13800 [Botrimarina colliarenosi]